MQWIQDPSRSNVDNLNNVKCNASRWRNYFSQLLNVHEDNDIRQAEIHTVEPLVPELSARV